MCRLFGLHAGRNEIGATFWLLAAPDNLAAQSRRNPDGTGLGVFGPGGRPELYKQPMAAWHDSEFATEAKELTGTTFLAHVRYATTGRLEAVNTHPFLQDGRVFAHNGVVEGLDQLDERLDSLSARGLVEGQTDSERVFALITACIRERGGDVSAGLLDAIGWVADQLPLYAVNVLLCTATDFWALRYPDTHELYVLDRRGAVGSFELRTDRIAARSTHLSAQPSVVFASERMDDNPAWRLLEPGELVHVDADLNITSQLAFPDPPRKLLHHNELSPVAQAAQRGQGSGQDASPPNRS